MKKLYILFALLSITLKVAAQVAIDTSAKNKLINAFYDAANLSDKQQVYNDLIKRFPENVSSKNETYDDLKRILGINYLAKGDTIKFKNYVSLITNKVMLAEFLNNVASHSNSKDSAVINKMAIASAIAVKLNHRFAVTPARYKPAKYTLPQWKQQISKQNEDYTYTYANVLYKQGRYDKAIQYIQAIYNGLKEPNDKIIEFYSILLGLTHYEKKAIEVIENTMATGYQSQALLNELKKDYLAIHGEKADFSRYVSDLQSASKAKLIVRIKQTMFKEPAPAFLLKDLDGRTVSLKELEGKVVIVDFWATWCGPCKESFPGMQLAVDKYKNNEQVKFLFIDTWETEKDYYENVKKFIADSKYTFHVLIDEVDEAGKQAKTTKAFNVDGIPTKFVIDKKGNIRFKSVGNIGSPNDILETISTMIDLSSGN